MIGKQLNYETFDFQVYVVEIVDREFFVFDCTFVTVIVFTTASTSTSTRTDSTTTIDEMLQ